MRSTILAFAAAAALLAEPPPPRQVIFARVNPQPGQLRLFVAAADASDEHPLLASADTDYDPVWAPDGASIVFTSERNGSADLFRVTRNGTELTRLTTDPAYDDQAAFAPDSRRIVFVSTRGGGRANLWTMDLATQHVRRLTSGPGGDYRPSWALNGKWIAFSSGRGNPMPFSTDAGSVFNWRICI
jgi:TolB protein